MKNAKQRRRAELVQSLIQRKSPARARAERAGVHLALGLMLLFVQLPLVWMVLTAFKQRGQAFQIRFWPQTTVAGEAPYQLAAIGAGGEPEVEIPESVQAPRDFSWREARPDGSAAWHVGFLLPPATGASARLYDGPASYVLATLADGTAEEISSAQRDAAIAAKDGRYQSFEDKSRGPSRTLELKPEGKGDGPRLWKGTLETPAGQEPPKEFYIDFERSWGQGLAAVYTLDNFRAILLDPEFNFGTFFLNSLLVSAGAGLLTVVLCSLAAYGFSRKEFPFRKPLFGLMLATMLIPGMIFMVPQFAITLKFGWMNTYQGMVVPHLANVFGLFLLKQYIDSLPDALFQAARIDGANDWQIFWRIVLPLSTPIVVTLFLLTFVGQWSNFLWQFIVNTGDSPWLTLPVGLQSFRGQFATRWELIMAGACFSIIPIAVLFVSVQKYFLMGMASGSVKE
jgi:multiple sugar transport system permease protein